MQGQGGGALMQSIAVSSVCWSWAFPGGVGQGQPQPVFFPEPPCWSYKQPEMTVSCAELGESRVKPSCESSLAFVSAGPGAH